MLSSTFSRFHFKWVSNNGYLLKTNQDSTGKPRSVWCLISKTLHFLFGKCFAIEHSVSQRLFLIVNMWDVFVTTRLSVGTQHCQTLNNSNSSNNNNSSSNNNNNNNSNAEAQKMLLFEPMMFSGCDNRAMVSDGSFGNFFEGEGEVFSSFFTDCGACWP